MRLALPALFCASCGNARLRDVAAYRKTNGFFDDMMDKFVVSDNDESKQSPPPEPEKAQRRGEAVGFGKWKMAHGSDAHVGRHAA